MPTGMRPALYKTEPGQGFLARSQKNFVRVLVFVFAMQYHASTSLLRYCIMATDKPRITISLTQEQYKTLHRLSTLQGMPMSRLVSDLVAEVAPVLEKVVEALSIAAKAQENVKVNLRRVVDQAEEDFRPIVSQVLNQFDMFADQLQTLVHASGDEAGPTTGAAATGGGTDSSPRPVITGAVKPQRGSGDGKGEIQKAGKSKVKSSSSTASPRGK